MSNFLSGATSVIAMVRAVRNADGSEGKQYLHVYGDVELGQQRRDCVDCGGATLPNCRTLFDLLKQAHDMQLPQMFISTLTNHPLKNYAVENLGGAHVFDGRPLVDGMRNGEGLRGVGNRTLGFIRYFLDVLSDKNILIESRASAMRRAGPSLSAAIVDTLTDATVGVLRSQFAGLHGMTDAYMRDLVHVRDDEYAQAVADVARAHASRDSKYMKACYQMYVEVLGPLYAASLVGLAYNHCASGAYRVVHILTTNALVPLVKNVIMNYDRLATPNGQVPFNWRVLLEVLQPNEVACHDIKGAQLDYGRAVREAEDEASIVAAFMGRVAKKARPDTDVNTALQTETFLSRLSLQNAAQQQPISNVDINAQAAAAERARALQSQTAARTDLSSKEAPSGPSFAKPVEWAPPAASQPSGPQPMAPVPPGPVAAYQSPPSTVPWLYTPSPQPLSAASWPPVTITPPPSQGTKTPSFSQGLAQTPPPPQPSWPAATITQPPQWPVAPATEEPLVRPAKRQRETSPQTQRLLAFIERGKRAAAEHLARTGHPIGHVPSDPRWDGTY